MYYDGYVTTHVDSVQIISIHDCSLEELHLSEVSFEKTLQLQVWLFPAE